METAPVHKSSFVGLIFAVHLLLFAQTSLAAYADCPSDSAIPTGVLAPIDVVHLRKVLAHAGFAVGGLYLGETFGNPGGLQRGETFDSVLWTYLLGELHKTGLWKGLCFYADAYQI